MASSSTDTSNGQSSSAVAGVFLEKTKETLTIYEAMKKRLLKRDICLALLQAQAATIGIVDVKNNKTFSVQEAVHKGIIGPEFKEKLLVAEKALRGYADPYNNEPLSVFQAIQKDVLPGDVGVRLLEAQAVTVGIYDPILKTHISEQSASERGHYDQVLLNNQTEVLKVFRDPVSQEEVTYKQLLEKCKVDPETGLCLLPVCITFKGLRRAVCSGELLASKIIDEETFDNLQKGKTTANDVMLMEGVKEYLDGKGSIAGVALTSSGDRMSIYQAMKKGIIMPGTALVLLEAQAATGFLIDPVKNVKYNVDDAVREKIVGPEFHSKLLSAERAVTGYKDPYTGDTISLFQALSKELIIKDHGIRLLEAQIATGGIIDPINSHRLPVDVAYKRGLFDEEMNAILEDPSDDTKGFFDPNTKDNLTYMQLMERSVIDPATGLSLLPIQKGESGVLNSTFIQYDVKLTFKKVMVTSNYGRYMGIKTSLWELLMSEYLTEKQRTDIIQQYCERKLTIEVIIIRVQEIIEHSVKSTNLTFEGIRETVTAEQLVEADIIPENVLQELSKGKTTVTEITEQEAIKTYLQGKSSIAGILLPNSQIMSIYQAQRKGKLRPGTSLILLEAQAATGFVIDPVLNTKLSVNDAVAANVVGREFRAKLLSAERAVTGYKDPSTGNTISLFQAMVKDYILKDHGIRLLEAQIATGGIIDPINSHRIPVHVAYQRGYFNVEMNEILNDPTDDTKGFFDPNTQENLTYLQLMERCVVDPNTGLCLLPLKGKDHTVKIHEQTRQRLKASSVLVKYGRFKDKQVTIWELLNSEYLSEEKRQDLLKQFTRSQITIERMTTVILEIIETVEVKNEYTFSGLRSNICMKDLEELGIVTAGTCAWLQSRSCDEIANDTNVAKYLRGTGSIAGLILKPSGQKVSIYDAMKKGILMPGTALCLLEAQAATGYIIDPMKNEHLTVEQAIQQNLIGPQVYDKLLSAERAVTGYVDPCSGSKISLFQAMQKELIVKEHGIRLLEAQIATGGIIDPLHCVHIPLEVAYRKGYFDADMNDILTDPTDDTKGFFDPNTKKNMTYLELMQQCIKDPETGLLLLPLQTDGKIEEKKIKSVEKVKIELERHLVSITVGQYTGKIVSVWELLHSAYFQDWERQELLEKYGLSVLTIEQIVERVQSTITKCEQGKGTVEMLTDAQTEDILKQYLMQLRSGKFAGKQVAVWEVLHSEYISAEKRDQIILDFKERKMTIEEIVTFVTAIVEEATSKRHTFKGLRRQVSASELFESKIISKEVLGKIIEGKITDKDMTEMDSVQKYLTATNSIAGVRVESKKTTMSIYEAKSKGLLTPGTSLVLLEAQAATGFVIDPVNNKKLSVEEAVAAGVVGSEWKSKLLSAERAVTGYTDPYTEKTISLFQALKKDLIVKDHGIRLLEAQIATGGIIDPVYSHRVPVEVAYQRGYFDEEMNQILLDPDDDTKGFFDPNTQDNLTYLQLIERCVVDPDTGLHLLQIVKKGEFYFFIDECTKTLFKSTMTKRAKGTFKGKEVSLWELLYSKYITEEKRRELVQQYRSGDITIDYFMELVLTIIQKTESSTTTVEQTQAKSTSQVKTTTTTIVETTFHGIRKDVTADELLESKVIDKKIHDDLLKGKVTVDHVSEMDSVRRYLQGTNCIAGVYVQSTKQTLSIYEAKAKGLLTPGTSLVLLEAQAATGFVIDPVNNRKLSVEEAVEARVVSPELKGKLLSAERAVTGYTDPYTGKTISLFQALKKDLIVKDHGIRLLEAQIATGGIIDPVYSHRVPVEVAYQRGYFDEEMNQILLDPDDDTKGFFDPNTQENLTYLQLVERCVKDPDTGLSLLVIVKKGEFYFFVDESTKIILKSTTTTKAGGKYSGQTVSLWELLYSQYITEEKRRDLVQQYKSGTITIEKFMESVLCIIQKKTSSIKKSEVTKESTKSQNTKTTTITTTTIEETFHGIRKDVTAQELLESKVIDQNTYDNLSAGKVTVDHVSQIDSVQKYLQGTNSIAGVYVQSTKQTLSIYEAKAKGLLTPGTSLVLLEAQAATGFVIDPVNNRKLSVEEAVAAGVVGAEWKSKLLSAERGVTGYTDPYTGNLISLFQALKKDLIVKDHGIRLLEAQIATGGIIDPVYSHRVPVEVAYQRGYFDEEMNQILLDPDDDTKGFFDPNTQENLTYLQLVERCVKDPDTGLSLLVIVKKGEFYFFVDESTKTILKSTTTTKAGGKYSGQTVSLWELLYSQYITEEKRRDLVQQYKSGTITIEKFMESVLCIIQKKTSTITKSEVTKESTKSQNTKTTTITTTTIEKTFHGIRKDVTAQELLESKVIDQNTYDNLSAGKVTVDHVSQIDSVQKYLQGTNSIAGVYVQSTKQTLSIYEAKAKALLTPGTSLVLLEAQAATGFVIDPVNNRKLSVEEAVAAGVVGAEWKSKLLSAERGVTGYTDPYTGNLISLFQALKKDLIVKDHGIRLLEAQIATGGIIDPVYSHRVPVEVAYQRGYFDEEMNQILLDPDDDTKGFFDPNTQENLTYLQLVERCVKDPDTGLSLLVIVKKGEFYFFVDESTKTILKSTTTTKAGGKYSGQTVSLWELLYSQYITEEKRRDLVQQYKSGTITIEKFMESVLCIIQKKTSTITKSEVTKESTKSQNTKTTTITTTTIEKTFHGIRKDVTAQELLESKVIDQHTYENLSAGKVTVDHVSQIDSVQKYLQGTNSIAGVYVQSTKQTLSIYEAKAKGLLTPGTSLVLLEAQAATGFVIDPVNNRKLSVEEAVAAGVVGAEWKSKLLSAERGVTGYTDPYTGNLISLFQALKKDLIVKDHGIRLLEAQIATGGIIDPVYSHRVPVEVAYQRGYFDEEMNQILLDPDDDTKGFFDPNTQENLTYLQLVERCVKDPDTGLSLLVIVKKGEFYFFVDESTKIILKSTTTSKAGGKYSGQTVSLWELLYSQYITEEKRRDLVQQYKSGTITIEKFMESVLCIIQKKTSTITKSEVTKESTNSENTKTTTITTTTIEKTFHGIRKDVTAQELLESKVIDQNTYDNLSAGKVTVDHVSQIDSVSRYLHGTNSIAGVYVQSTKQTLSIYEAKAKGLLTPGTSLVLLEAQAATGFVIDPVNNRKLSVEEGVAAGVVGAEWKSKLLSAERGVTGYTDPYTGNLISLFQALKKDLIVKDHGIRLLEAQIATGGIIDPVYSHRVPVEVAYQRGYFDEEMNQILLDPDDDTKGFFDPNTQENLTYLQLVERCVKDPDTGLSLLVIVKKGEFYFFVDESTKTILKSTTTTKAGGKYSGQTVSLWELLYSQYITEEKRRDLVQQYKSGTITIEKFMESMLCIIQKKTSTTTKSEVIKESTKSLNTKTTTITMTTTETTFHGIRKDVTAQELLESKVIDQNTYDDLSAGKVTVDHVSQIDSVSRYLHGTNSIAGVYVQSTKQTLSIYEAKAKGLLTPGTSLVLLEAQAATGFVIDPVNNRKLSVEEAVAAGVVGAEWKSKLLSAERGVTGYTDPYTGNLISLFQALKKDLIVKDHGIRLLEAQIATGGIIDPVYSHRVPVEVAYQRGYFDEEINQILLDPDDDTKGFFDPNTQENLTYLQLVERCVKDPDTGLSLLVIVKKGEFYFFVDESTKTILKSTTTTKAGGKYSGQTVSLWELLYSQYITEEKRRDLVQQYKSGTITIEIFLEYVLTIIQKKTSTSTTTIITTTTETTFHGIRKDVTAQELLESKVIDQNTYDDLSAGKVTVDHVSQIDSVSRYLHGTNSIAGVYVQSTKQTMSIYEAKAKGLLTPGTSLVLLEAQAATGFVIDPVNNRKLSVEEAVAAGVVGAEWKSKLLSAERGVTGYTDPYTGNLISLFQALKKDLIVKDHGIRLLEAQIATGGIIDPVYSHRVPVEVAYQRGYFDEEMNQILLDPDDDTKGFFDPNTQENLTYLQLVDRCVKDATTGLSLLSLNK
ncbi:epiplakin isoform X2 [Engraulis encrasicolus]